MNIAINNSAKVALVGAIAAATLLVGGFAHADRWSGGHSGGWHGHDRGGWSRNNGWGGGLGWGGYNNNWWNLSGSNCYWYWTGWGWQQYCTPYYGWY